MMERKEKERLKAEISKHINLRNGRFTVAEITRLHDLVESRDSHDGRSETYSSSYEAFDSEGTYRIEEADTYTFHNGDSGICIEQKSVRDWDDGQHDIDHQTHDTERAILRLLRKLKI